jgi:hypothetical protein
MGDEKAQIPNENVIHLNKSKPQPQSPPLPLQPSISKSKPRFPPPNKSDYASICQLAPKKSTDKDPLVYVSTSTIANCEEACDIIGQLEILLSRALSMLPFFPGQHDLVDILLQCKDEQFILMTCPRERSAFLSGIKHQQQMITPNALQRSPIRAVLILQTHAS